MRFVDGGCTLPDAMPERGPVRAAKQWHSTPLGYTCMLPEMPKVYTCVAITGTIHMSTDTEHCARMVGIICLSQKNV